MRIRNYPFVVLAALCMIVPVIAGLAGCGGTKPVNTPPPGTTATGGIPQNPSAAPAARYQAQQQAQMGQGEQMLMRQAQANRRPSPVK